MLGPVIHFREPFEDRVAFEVPLKGWYTGVTVELPDGSLWPLSFYDPTRLAQDLSMSAEHGEPFVAEHNMIVLPEVNEANMRACVAALFARGWLAREHCVRDAT